MTRNSLGSKSGLKLKELHTKLAAKVSCKNVSFCYKNQGNQLA